MRTPYDLATGAPLNPVTIGALFARSGLVVSRAYLLRDGNYVATLPVTGGRVTFSRSAQMFARLSGLEVDASAADLPTVSGGRLTPAGWEVRIWAGMRLPGRGGAELPLWLLDENGVVVTTESGEPIYLDMRAVPASTKYIDAVCALGTFPLESSQVDKFGVVAVDAWDRSSLLAADLLTSTLVWPGDHATLEDAVDDLVHRTFPTILTSFVGATHACPVESFERDGVPLRIITEASTSVGCFARFDGNGHYLWTPEPDLSSTQPVVEFTEGRGGTLVDISASVTSQAVHNSWTVIGTNPTESATADIIATVYDDTPGSPTQWGGPFGRRPKPAVRMELVDTQAKADAAALTMRAAEIGFGVDISATCVPNWMVEPGDVVWFGRAAAGVDGPSIVEDQTFELGPGSMELRARARQVTS